MQFTLAAILGEHLPQFYAHYKKKKKKFKKKKLKKLFFVFLIFFLKNKTKQKM